MTYNLLIVISILWIVINLLNIIFKVSFDSQLKILINIFWFCFQFYFKIEYTSLIHSLGIQVKPYQLTLYSTSFNRLFYIFANFNSRIINKWFAIGAMVSIVCIIPSVLIIGKNIINFMVKSNQTNIQYLIPVVR